MAVTGQPIIRGIQAVGGVTIKYQYNNVSVSENQETKAKTYTYKLPVPSSFGFGDVKEIDTTGGIQVAGFRLDGEFLRAVQQIASSVVIPILGGGGVALTNNNRTGTLNINATKVSTPDLSTEGNGKMLKGASGFGPQKSSDVVYDLTLIAQLQQAQEGGDSVGATIAVCFDFCGKTTIVQFEGCTIASVDPVGLSGNDAVNYNVSINYLNWRCAFNQGADAILPED